MDNKGFLEYLRITGELDLRDESFIDEIDNIKRCDVYLGDIYLKLKKLGVNYGNILMFLDLTIEKAKKKDIVSILESCIRLLSRYKFYVNEDIKRYNSSLLTDILILDNLDERYFLDKSIVINTKKITIDSKLYSMDTYSEKVDEHTFRWLLRMKGKDKIDVILCKNNKHKFIEFEDDNQIKNLRRLAESNKDYDLLLIGYYASSYKESKERVQEILKGVLYE